MLGASKWADPARIGEDITAPTASDSTPPPEEEATGVPEDLSLNNPESMASPLQARSKMPASHSPTRLPTPPEERAPTEQLPMRVVKKMITAKGKRCPVLIPYEQEPTADEGNRRPFPLSTEEVQAIMEKWENLGYNVTPFDARDNSDNSDGCRSDGDTLLRAGRTSSKEDVVITIPDPRGWQMFVHMLNERKLRELGVPLPANIPMSDHERLVSPAFSPGLSRFGTPGPSILSIGTPGPSLMSASRLGSPPLSRIGTPGSLASMSSELRALIDVPGGVMSLPPRPPYSHVSRHSMAFLPPVLQLNSTEPENPMKSFKFPATAQSAEPRVARVARELGYFSQMPDHRSNSSIPSGLSYGPSGRGREPVSVPGVSPFGLPATSASAALGRIIDEPMGDRQNFRSPSRPNNPRELEREDEVQSEPGPSRQQSIVPPSEMTEPSVSPFPPPESQSSDSITGRIFSRDITPPPMVKHAPKLSKSSLNAQAAAFTFNPAKSPFDPLSSTFEGPSQSTVPIQPIVVHAKPTFDPNATFKPSNFSALTATAKAFEPTGHTPSSSRDVSGGSAMSIPKSSFNVKAPAFQPKMQIPSGEFSFMSSYSTRNPSTTTFGESDYGGAGLSDTMTSVGMSSSEGPQPGKIFGNIADAFKVPKKSKPLSIRRPESPKVGLGIGVEESEEDDTGRAQRPQGRGKRARASKSGDHNGDEIPMFASPADEVTSAVASPASGSVVRAALRDQSDSNADGPTSEPLFQARRKSSTLPRRPQRDTLCHSQRDSPQSSQRSSVRRLRRISSSMNDRSSTMPFYPAQSASTTGTAVPVRSVQARNSEDSPDAVQALFDRVASKSFRRKGIPNFVGENPISNSSQAMRSGAPSPSPSAHKIVEDRHVASVMPSTWRATQTLRNYQPTPGVHRLNANEEIPTSDWDDEFPDDQEDYKLHRLARSGSEQASEPQQSPDPAPQISHIESALTNIQQSLAALSAQQASLTVAHKTRRAPSSDMLSSALGVQSDADDEDDSHDEHGQAPPVWARQRSPRRFRKEDRLRLLVREAVEEGMERDTLEELGDMKEILASLQLSELDARQQLGELHASVQEMNEHHLRAMELMPLNNAVLSAPSEPTISINDDNDLREELGRLRAEVTAGTKSHEATKQELEKVTVRLSEQVKLHVSTEESLREMRDLFHEEKAMHASTLAQFAAATKLIETNHKDYKETEARSSAAAQQLLQQVQDMSRREALQRATVQMKTPALEKSRAVVNDLQKALSASQAELMAERTKVRQVMSGNADMARSLKTITADLEAKQLGLNDMARKTGHREATMQAQIMTLQSQLRDLNEHQGLEISQAKAQLQLQVDSLRSQQSVALAEQQMHLSDINAERQRLLLDLEAEKVRNSNLAQNLQTDYEAAKQAAVHQIREQLKAQHTSEVMHYKRSLELELQARHQAETVSTQGTELLRQELAQKDEQILFLTEQIQISREAARAAVKNAQQHALGSNNTSSTSPSPVKQRTISVSGGSLRLRSDASSLPSKISPQALRESIFVLQEQLQHRESRIEDLEADLAAAASTTTNSSTPSDLAAQQLFRETAEVTDLRLETEVAWLRELLEVRLEDLRDLVQGLDEEFYDRDAVRDAAVRLRAGLEMEVQERERAASMLPLSTGASATAAGNLTASDRLTRRLTDLARVRSASPASAPLKQALGNLRKAREGGASYLGMAANALNERIGDTPLKGSGGVAGGFLGMFTPPSTKLRPSSSGSLAGVGPGGLSRGPSFSGLRVQSSARGREMVLGAGRSGSRSGMTTEDGAGNAAESVDNSPTKGRGKGKGMSRSGIRGTEEFDGDAERLDTGDLYGRMAAQAEAAGEESQQEEGIFGEESFVFDH